MTKHYEEKMDKGKDGTEKGQRQKSLKMKQNGDSG